MMDATHTLKKLYYRARDSKSCIQLNEEQLNRCYNIFIFEDNEKITDGYIYYENGEIYLGIGFTDKDGINSFVEYTPDKEIHKCEDFIYVITGIEKDIW